MRRKSCRSKATGDAAPGSVYHTIGRRASGLSTQDSKAASWDVPISEAQPQFLREQYLLKARQVIINTLSVRVTNHICRYLYLKLLIYRPVLSKSLHRILSTGTERGLSGAWICANFTMDCSVFCVQSAIDLIDLVHETCHTNLASVWYYNVFCEHSTASLIPKLTR